MIAPDRLLSVAELAGLLGWTARGINRRARRENWPATPDPAHSQRRLYRFGDLPDIAQAEILLQETAQEAARIKREAQAREAEQTDSAALWEAWGQAKGSRRRAAEARHAALMEVEQLHAQGRTLKAARVAVARKSARGISERTLRRWGEQLSGKPRTDWLPLLMPAARPDGTPADMPESAWHAFLHDYLRLERPAAESCYRRLQARRKANGWPKLPALKTLVRRLEREIPADQIILARDGEEALELIGPKVARTRLGMHAMERVNSDGHVIDVFVKFPDGSIGRPTLVGWQDIYSGKLLSWRVGKSETSDLVRLSFCDMVKVYGIPLHAHLDNGRAYASKKNTGGMATRYRYKVKTEEPDGVFKRLGVAVQWVTPYNGKAKPIERAWRDVAQDIAKHPAFAGAYVGNHPNAKPENYGSRAVPFEEFMTVLNGALAEHNARTGRRSEVCAGRYSFDGAFNASYEQTAIKRATEQQLALLLLASDLVKVRANAEVMLAGNRYYARCLVPLIGQTVELRFDPENLHQSVHVVATDGTPIGEAKCIAAIGWGSDEEAREAIRAKREYRKSQKKEKAALQRVLAAHGAASAPLLVPIGASKPAAAVQMFTPKRSGKTAHPEAANAAPRERPAVVANWFKSYGVGGDK